MFQPLAKIEQRSNAIRFRQGPTPEDLDRRDKAARWTTIERLTSQAGAKYRECRLSNFQATRPAQKNVLKALQEYLAGLAENLALARGVVLYGPCGTGKDHLMFGLVGQVIWDTGKDAKWLNGQTWFGELRDAIDDDRRSEESIINGMVSPALLVISDPLPPLADDRLSSYQSSMLYRVINGRYAAGKPTFLTLNVRDDEEADRRLGAPTWDRCFDGSYKLFCSWPSYRKPFREVK